MTIILIMKKLKTTFITNKNINYNIIINYRGLFIFMIIIYYIIICKYNTFNFITKIINAQIRTILAIRR